MDLRLHILAAILFVVALIETNALSLPSEDLEEVGKSAQTETEEDKRATWLDTRDLESKFKELVYNALQQLSAEGKISPDVVPKAASNDVVDKRRRWQGFCFRKTRSGRFLPYICWKGGKK